MQTTKVYHFHNGCGGGVLSVIRNLIKFSNNAIENHVIYTINKIETCAYKPEEITGALSQQVFYYNPKNNFYHTCRQLAKLLPDKKVIIVAHDWLELGMASNLGLQNPIVQFLHGDYDYYYQLAKKNEAVIDNFICISPVIFKKLKLLISSRNKSIHQLYFPVPEIPYGFSENKNLNLFYAVRDLEDGNKNFELLPKMDSVLNDAGVKVHWTIIGKVNANSDTYKHLSILKYCKHFSYLANEDLITLLNKMNVFVLPSQNEGFPVILVECMKAGIVPLVTNWNEATSELLIEGENGFYIELDNAAAYAEKINFLNNNRDILKQFSENASAKANELFDPYLNTRLIEEVYQKAITNLNKKKIAEKIYGSRLDQSMLPNFFVKKIRSFLN